MRTCAACVGAIRCGAPMAQPMRQPVHANDLPALPTVIVRSHMPESDARRMCSCPSYVRQSYTSSLITRMSYLMHSDARRCSSSSVHTLPIGLCGVLRKSALARGEASLASSVAQSNCHSFADTTRSVDAGGTIGTYTGTPPWKVTSHSYWSKNGSNSTTSSPGSRKAHRAEYMASFAPAVTTISRAGSRGTPASSRCTGKCASFNIISPAVTASSLVGLWKLLE